MYWDTFFSTKKKKKMFSIRLQLKGETIALPLSTTRALFAMTQLSQKSNTHFNYVAD